MELKPGYKITEVGLIPSEWDMIQLGDATIKVGSGITPTGGERVYKTEGRPFVRSQNVDWGHLLLNDIAFIDEETHTSFSATEIKLNDVLLNITGASIGRSAIADQRLIGGNVNQHVCIIRTDTDKLSPHYLNLFLLSERGQKQIDSFQAGGNRQGLNFQQIKSFRLILPPLPEQRAIAEALGDVDALITSLDKLIAKKRLIKQGAMQELLTGKKRLPGFRGEWKETTLGVIGKCHRGVSYDPNVDLSPFDTNSTIRLLRSNNVQEGKLVFVDMQYVNKSRISDIQLMQPKDILVCTANGNKALVGKAAQFPSDESDKYTFGAFMGCFRPNSQIAIPEFVFYLFFTYKYRTQISVLLAGSSINNLTPGNLEALSIIIPVDIGEQDAIAKVLSDMDAEITALEEKLAKVSLLKQGMMQELLTGRIRLV